MKALLTRRGLFAALLISLGLVFALVLAGAAGPRKESPGTARCRDLARHFQLTDLALWNEARHVRHPSQADLSGASGDFPGAMDPFPAGSLSLPQARGKAKPARKDRP